MKTLVLFAIVIMLLFTTGCGESENTPSTEPTESTVDTSVEWSQFFGEADGTAVFYDSAKMSYYISNQELSEKRSSPCSSFKIISALMGLESGVIKPTDSERIWNGIAYPIKEWNQDINYQDAFQVSCIWYYRQVLDEIGQEYVQGVLNDLNYGNCDITKWKGTLNNMIFPELREREEINGFWQESSLQISPKEQVEVLRRIFQDQKEFTEENIELLKEVMTINNPDSDIRIYGKTGSGILDDTWNDGWFVGFFEQDNHPVYFAIRLNQPGKRGADAKEIGIQIINDYFNQ